MFGLIESKIMPLNIPNGTIPSDISSRFECEACGGSGQVEAAANPDDQDGDEIPATAPTVLVTCPECSGLGTINRRVQ